MVTRSIVGRFLILAVLLVSLGVIAQAALIISHGPRTVAKALGGSAVAAPVALASLGTTTANAATPSAADVAVAPAADAAPVRVVYPGPLGDAPIQPRKITDAAPAVAPAQVVATKVAAAQPASVAPPAAPDAAVPAAAVTPVVSPPVAAAPAAVVVASADADTQPVPSTHGVNLNSATVDELNRVGGGHIGQSIVQHRPYRSVEDLVKKRVVRRSVYEQIKNQVAAD